MTVRRLAEKSEKNLKVDQFLGRLEADARPISVTEAASIPEGVIGRLTLVVAQADIINRNGRFYSLPVYAVAVERAQGDIADGVFLGEVDHPDWSATLRKAAFRFTKLWMDGMLVRAEGLILNNAEGQHLKSLVDGGVGVNVSTRGYATSEYKDIVLPGTDVTVQADVIGDDYWMEGIDFVLRGSNPAGKVDAHTESLETPTMKLDLETLKRDFPELVEAITAAARENMVTAEESAAAIANAVEAAVEATTVSAKAEALAAPEVKEGETARVVIEAILEAVKPFLPEVAAAAEARSETELAATVTAMAATVATLESQVRESAAREAAAREAVAAADLRASLNAHIEKVLNGHAHAAIIRPAMEACQTVEAIDATLVSEVARITAIEAALVGTTGTGKAEVAPANGSKALSVDEQKKADERRIADKL